MRSLAHVVAATAFFLAAPAQAQPDLLTSTPGANATVKSVSKVQLSFSETLVAKLSTAELVMTGMPGMEDHAPMPVRGQVAIGADGKSLVMTFARPLVPGSYALRYRVAAADAQPVTGSLEFKVR